MPIARPASAADADHLRAVAETSGLLAPDEVVFLFDAFHAAIEEPEAEAVWHVSPAGAAMLEPEPMSDAVWKLRFIAVRPEARRRGEARALMSGSEAAARHAGGRLLLVDTASDDGTAAARALYAALGYDREAVIRDFYGDGVDRVTCRRRL